jgi:hypothetical protein
MTATRALTWVSRALFGMGGALFVAESVYMVTRLGSTEVLADGETASSMSSGEAHVAALLFAAVAWSLLSGAAVRVLARAKTWPRALLSISELVGFGLFFVAPLFAVKGGEEMRAAFAFVIAGFLVIIVSRIVSFAVFGAKEAAERLQWGIRQARGTVAGQYYGKSVGQPGLFNRTSAPSTREPLEPEYPSPGGQGE